ncbi:unnamed protein product [Phytophthora fragariaefolia]|uniref:Unnamed protein product n=1 Tax=Phytophthora fragariaefolia TaxID=1490495 RepID=A0A9W6X2U8_9STRA|nr:unnamed protein product [Phytophthora fragariaefolia]
MRRAFRDCDEWEYAAIVKFAPPPSCSVSSTSATGAGTSAVGGVPSVQQVATSSVTMSAPPMMATVMTAHSSQAGPGGGLAGGHVAGAGGDTAGVSGGYVAGAGGQVAGVAPGVGVSGFSLAGPAPGANVWPAAGVGALGAGVAPSSGIGLSGGVARVGMQVAGGAGAYGAGVPQFGLVEQHPGVGGLTSMKLDISHKPPVMEVLIYTVCSFVLFLPALAVGMSWMVLIALIPKG